MGRGQSTSIWPDGEPALKQRFKELLPPNLKSPEWHDQMFGHYEEALKKSEKWNSLIAFILPKVYNGEDRLEAREGKSVCRNLKKKQGKITVRLEE